MEVPEWGGPGARTADYPASSLGGVSKGGGSRARRRRQEAFQRLIEQPVVLRRVGAQPPGKDALQRFAKGKEQRSGPILPGVGEGPPQVRDATSAAAAKGAKRKRNGQPSSSQPAPIIEDGQKPRTDATARPGGTVERRVKRKRHDQPAGSSGPARTPQALAEAPDSNAHGSASGAAPVASGAAPVARQARGDAGAHSRRHPARGEAAPDVRSPHCRQQSVEQGPPAAGPVSQTPALEKTKRLRRALAGSASPAEAAAWTGPRAPRERRQGRAGQRNELPAEDGQPGQRSSRGPPVQPQDGTLPQTASAPETASAKKLSRLAKLQRRLAGVAGAAGAAAAAAGLQHSAVGALGNAGPLLGQTERKHRSPSSEPNLAGDAPHAVAAAGQEFTLKPCKQRGGAALAYASEAAQPSHPAQRSGGAGPQAQRGNSGGGARAARPGLLDAMRTKLAGAHFRWVNEQLYTRDGDAALQLFDEQPQLFQAYHEGFRHQTAGWPAQPVAAAAAWLAGRGGPRGLDVADFGCGEAALAAAASPPHRVTGLDLVASAPGVVACNMARTPLGNDSQDVAVFCLALMGTDYPAFLAEAHRVLRPRGALWIAEVRSRFVPRAGGVEDFRTFTMAVEGLGFRLAVQDASNAMFVVFVFDKLLKKQLKQLAAWPHLRACVYKKR